jgi:hypothetical protein
MGGKPWWCSKKFTFSRFPSSEPEGELLDAIFFQKHITCLKAMTVLPFYQSAFERLSLGSEHPFEDGFTYQ